MYSNSMYANRGLELMDPLRFQPTSGFGELQQHAKWLRTIRCMLNQSQLRACEESCSVRLTMTSRRRHPSRIALKHSQPHGTWVLTMMLEQAAAMMITLEVATHLLMKLH
jgi:hypothetical protein